jgi:hypothetical protein
MNKHEITPKMKAKQWQPGQSGNPHGRPRKRPISEAYEDRAQMTLDEDLCRALKLAKGSTYADAAALAVFRAAIKGRPDAARELREAIEGKQSQRLELTGPNAGPVHDRLDLSRLTDAELATLQALSEKVGKKADSKTPDIDDGEAE